MNPFDLTGRKALVTGGSRGLGRGMAQALVEAGAQVAILSRSTRILTTARELSDQTGRAVIPIQAAMRGQKKTTIPYINM